MRVLFPKESQDVASVTAVIPCYNYGRYLPLVMESVLSQERVNVRVIIVDDASSDGSAQVARNLASLDPRITVVAHARNQGHIASYNDGLARVESEFVTLISADDLLAPGALGRATDLMIQHPRVGMVYGMPLSFDKEEGGPDQSNPGRLRSWTIWRGREWLLWACWRGRNFILSPEVVMRTEAMRQVGSYNSDLPHSGDLEYWLRTAVRWDIGRINGPVQAYYRIHGNNMHLTTYNTMQADLDHRRAAFDVLSTAALQDVLPDCERLHRLSRWGLCREALLLAERNLDSGGPSEVSLAFLQVARSAFPSADATLRGRAVLHRLRLSRGREAPQTVQRLIEGYRHQLDRARWVAWRKVGIS